MSDEPFAQVLAALDKFQREIIERIDRLNSLIKQSPSASEKPPSSSVGSVFTEPERELLLVVAKWMLRLEGGAFRGMRGSLRPADRTDAERQLAILQALIEQVVALKSTPLAISARLPRGYKPTRNITDTNSPAIHLPTFARLIPPWPLLSTSTPTSHCK